MHCYRQDTPQRHVDMSSLQNEHCADENTPICLASLPVPALARILAQLTLSDIAHFSQSCHQLHAALSQPALWQLLCVLRWGDYTLVNTWHTPTHRELYAQLCQYAHLPGLWQPLGPDPPRCLYAFAWRPDCMQCWTLRPAHNPPAPLHATPCVRLDGTGSQGPTRLEFLDGRIVVLQQELPNAEGLASPHSDAVAAVAINTPGSDAEALGSSPAGSFAHEMAQFMRGRVDGRRSRSRRRMARSPSGGMLDTVHHLERLARPVTEAGVLLSGLWSAVLPGCGPLLLSICTKEKGGFEGQVMVAPPRGAWPRGMVLLLGTGADLQTATPANLVSFAEHMDEIEEALLQDTDEPPALCLALRSCRHPLHARAQLHTHEGTGLDGLDPPLADVWLCGDVMAVVDTAQGEMLIASRVDASRDLPAGVAA